MSGKPLADLTLDEQRAEADECVCGHWRCEHRRPDGPNGRFPGITCCLFNWQLICPCDRFQLAKRAPWSVMYE